MAGVVYEVVMVDCIVRRRTEIDALKAVCCYVVSAQAVIRRRIEIDAIIGVCCY